MTVVLVPRDRVERWVANFVDRHGGVELSVAGAVLNGVGADGSTFSASFPLNEGSFNAEVASFAATMTPPEHWGVLLVRKGGFAVARMGGDRIVESKVGQRHVQGRTKAGGQSQQRFARRRGNQARQAYEAAAEHAVRILGSAPLRVVVGGDRGAVDEVLADPRLARVSVVGPWLPVPDPRRGVLEAAIADACAARIEVVNAE